MFIESLRDVSEGENLREYKLANDDVQCGIRYSQIRHHRPSDWGLYQDSTPHRIAERLDPDRSAVKAAMWTGAITSRAQNNTIAETVAGGPNLSFTTIWKNTNLEPLAAKSEEELDSVQPKTTNAITQIDVKNMAQERVAKIRSAIPEFLVFSGWNGVGKDWMIGHLKKFLSFCGIPYSETKMPNPNGVLFPIIDDFLKGRIKLERNAAQLLFLSDAINTEISSANLAILNRSSAHAENLVYGDVNLQPTILSSFPLFEGVFHTVIIDRHPAIALDSILKRETEPRIFERRLEALLDQHERFAALTSLPGYRWLTADFGTNNYKKQVIYSVNRLLCMVQNIGIVQRTMVKLGLAENYAQADIILDENYWKFKEQNGLLL